MIVKNHDQYSDSDFEELFASYRLKPRLFTHEAHLRLAYIHLKKYGMSKAEKNMSTQIKGYAQSLKAYDKFNLTVSIASVKILKCMIDKSSTHSFEALIDEFPVLINDFKSLLKQHYSFNVFADAKAKKSYIKPDLLPFE